MPNKLRLNIDLSKIQGALWFTSPKSGEKCLVIVPSKSRMKRYESKKEGAQDAMYFSAEIVPLKNPPLDREDTHFVVEPTTRDEREQANPPRLPILGSAREFAPYGNSPNQPRTTPAPAAQASNGASVTDGLEDDDIPF